MVNELDAAGERALEDDLNLLSCRVSVSVRCAEVQLERRICGERRTGPVAETFNHPKTAKREQQRQGLGEDAPDLSGVTPKSASESVEKYHLPRLTWAAAS